MARCVFASRHRARPLNSVVRRHEMAPANDQPPQGLARFGAWLSIRRNFMRFSILAFGGGTLIGMAVMFHPTRPMDWLVLSALCLAGGYVWGLFMWQFFEARRKEWAKWGKRDV